ncbi:MAG TPA: FAD-dependent oxidoreductase [Methanomassiliicoccales archaeon]|nr:FAD-dependent oxidoreductase [Methanomassiliicoccales archaeon]
MREVLIIGGGTAGLTAAKVLSQNGVRSTMIDKAPSIGGTVNELACKGLVQCVRCDVCLAVDQLAPVLQDERIRIITDARLDILERDLGIYRVTLEHGPQHIDDGACTRCGKCLEACPAGAISRTVSRSGVLIRMDRELCRNDNCQACVDACAHHAIDLMAEPESEMREVDAVIVGTGFEPFDPALDPRLHYNEHPDVITGMEAERMVRRKGRLSVPSDGRPAKKVAFLQCIGSRDTRLGAQLCSKVCCKYAMKMAQQLIAAAADSEAVIFFMDWRPMERRDDLLAWASSEPRARAVRSRPAEVVDGADGRPALRYASTDDLTISEEQFDLIILSVGMWPSPDNQELADLMGIKLNPHGFFFGEGKAVRSLEAKGIFFAGACTGPKDIEESAMEGAATAAKAVRYIGGLP